MNVLFVINARFSFSSQIAQLALTKGLKSKGVNITVMGKFAPEVIDYFKKNNISYIEMFPLKKIDYNFINKFGTYVANNNIEIVHFVSGNFSRSGLIALKKLPNVKVVTYFGSISLHWYDPSSYLTYLHPRVNKIIGNSNYVYEHVKKQLFFTNKKKAARIFKGYNPDWFNNVVPFDYSKLGISKNSIVVCSVSNHRKIKGTRYFLEATNYLDTQKEVHFILIGSNTEDDSLKKYINSSKISKNIHVLGKRDDVPSLLAGADIYVQTSLSEGFGRAISEAMSVGKPIVMTNAGGCTELIDKNSGIIVPLKNAKKVGAAISKLTNDDSLRIKMGHNAKERISTVYHIDKTTEDTYKLYNDLLNE